MSISARYLTTTLLTSSALLFNTATFAGVEDIGDIEDIAKPATTGKEVAPKPLNLQQEKALRALLQKKQELGDNFSDNQQAALNIIQNQQAAWSAHQKEKEAKETDVLVPLGNNTHQLNLTEPAAKTMQLLMSSENGGIELVPYEPEETEFQINRRKLEAILSTKPLNPEEKQLQMKEENDQKQQEKTRLAQAENAKSARQETELIELPTVPANISFQEELQQAADLNISMIVTNSKTGTSYQLHSKKTEDEPAESKQTDSRVLNDLFVNGPSQNRTPSLEVQNASMEPVNERQQPEPSSEKIEEEKSTEMPVTANAGGWLNTFTFGFLGGASGEKVTDGETSDTQE